MEVYQDTMIYIFCPPDKVTGGPEALHQLCYYLEREGYNAYIVYNRTGIMSPPPRYKQYNVKVLSYQNIKDNNNHILIVPEYETYCLRYYHHIRKVIWWLSYLAYDGLKSFSVRTKLALGNFVKFFLNICKKDKYVYRNCRKAAKLTDDLLHLCGSKYAYDMIQCNHRIKMPMMLVEPISKDFLDVGMADNLTSESRRDVIAYNPAKPSEIMNRLLLHDELTFVPLKGMTPTELIKLYREIKLYVDFGKFPGPERIPKEAVYNGACILVGKRNAAENDFDVAIPNQYKIDEINNEQLIVDRIKNILKNYDVCIDDFQSFRFKIDKLEENFVISIHDIFKRV